MGRVLAKQLIDGHVAPGLCSFAWHFLRDSHIEALRTPTRALAQLAAVDEELAVQWAMLLAGTVSSDLTAEAFYGAAGAGAESGHKDELEVDERNKHEVVLGAIRYRLLTCRRESLQARPRASHLPFP